MAADDGVQSWFGQLSFKVKRRVAQAIKDEADALAEKIKAAAPVKSGRLRDSVQVRRKRNDIDLEVTAGGDATTGDIRRGSGEPFDYARAIEFGTTKMPAQPFFFSTYRENRDEIRQSLNDAIAEAMRDS